MPCNTAHFWYDDVQKKIDVPILSIPKEVYKYTNKNTSKNSKIGLLATEATLNNNIYHKFFLKDYDLISPNKNLQKNSVNKAITLVKKGRVKEAEKVLRPAVNQLIKKKCKRIILGCTELPIAIFAYKSFKKAIKSKIFIDPNLLVAEVCMKKYKSS